tara:strand:- start:409 stop:855 length:447 start_codon:yes stop_codon:yes gene_type:complete
MKKYTVTLEEDPATGDVILPFPEEMLTEVGWEEGDVLVWKDNQDGTFSITKKPSEEKEWILVETVSQFRQRYMVEVPKGKADWALDTVTMNEAKEFSQEHLGETIVSHRVISQADALALCDLDNEYGGDWTEKQKIQAFFTREGEKVE